MPLFITPQIQTVPSIPWAVLQAPTFATEAEHYQGHLPGSGVQRHSADYAYAHHGIVMECHEATGMDAVILTRPPRHLWLPKKGSNTLVAHPRHDAALFMALALITGA